MAHKRRQLEKSTLPSLEDWTSPVLTQEDGGTISLPARTVFYGINPEGVGSAYIESATSYLVRLAQAHAVSAHVLTGEVVREEAAARLGSAETITRGRRSDGSGNGNIEHLILRPWAILGGKHKYPRLLNGTGSAGQDILLPAVSRLTGHSSLASLTMLLWKGSLSSINLLKETQAWCPVCYQQQADGGRPVYSPLLWSLRVVVQCPIHGTPLLDRCHHCRAEVLHIGVPLGPKLVRGQVGPGHCPTCHGWLGMPLSEIYGAAFLNDHPAGTESEDVVLHLWIGSEVGTLLAYGGQVDVSPVVSHLPEAIEAAACSYFSYLPHRVLEESMSALARVTGVPSKTMYCWTRSARRKVLPRLDDALLLCYSLGLHLLDCILGRSPMPTVEWAGISTRASAMRRLLIRVRDAPPSPTHQENLLPSPWVVTRPLLSRGEESL